MKTSRTKVKRSLSAAIEAQPLDQRFRQASFVHQRGTLRYRRACVDLLQVVEFCFDLGPQYEPNAQAHVLPQVQVYSDAVVPVITAMTSTRAAARAYGGPMLFRHQINNIAPLTQREDQWFVYDEDQVHECAGRLSRFTIQWCLPLLEEYRSLADLADGYEQGDERLFFDRRFRLYMSACYVVLGRPQLAMENLERFFGKPGPRRDYTQAFDYVSTLMG